MKPASTHPRLPPWPCTASSQLSLGLVRPRTSFRLALGLGSSPGPRTASDQLPLGTRPRASFHSASAPPSASYGLEPASARHSASAPPLGLGPASAQHSASALPLGLVRPRTSFRSTLGLGSSPRPRTSFRSALSLGSSPRPRTASASDQLSLGDVPAPSRAPIIRLGPSTVALRLLLSSPLALLQAPELPFGCFPRPHGLPHDLVRPRTNSPRPCRLLGLVPAPSQCRPSSLPSSPLGHAVARVSHSHLHAGCSASSRHHLGVIPAASRALPLAMQSLEALVPISIQASELLLSFELS